MVRISTIALLVSVVIVFIPEPITSVIGIVGVLVSIGLRLLTDI